jgi:hypothetical protein
MDKFLVTLRSENPVTGPILVTTSPRSSCPHTCPLRKGSDDPLAGVCYAEHGALGGYVWSLLDRTPVGRSFQNGNIRVLSLLELTLVIRRLPPGALWRHNQAGDLAGRHGATIDEAKLAELVAANRGRRGFTFTHCDVLTNLVNRRIIAAANRDGLTINLSANSLAHADQLADLRIAPVTTILPAGAAANARTPTGRKVVICPARTHVGVTCSTCQLCSRQRSVIVGFPATGRHNQKIV